MPKISIENRTGNPYCMLLLSSIFSDNNYCQALQFNLRKQPVAEYNVPLYSLRYGLISSYLTVRFKAVVNNKFEIMIH